MHQVEHPVTEMITGIDLIQEQIKVAQGQKLSFTQDDIKFKVRADCRYCHYVHTGFHALNLADLKFQVRCVPTSHRTT
jgi:biotin carboxylase